VAEGAIADTANIDGKIYGFCSAMCKEEVVADPQKYLSKK
jgi:YHS domain-containing protein